MKINPAFTLKVLLLIIFLLFVGNIISLALKFQFSPIKDVYLNFFDFDQESNFPSFYSTLAILVAAFLLSFITYIRKVKNLSYVLWFFLALGFLFLAIDESIEIHEKIGNQIRRGSNLTGVFHYPWVIPYGLFVIFFAIVYYFKFLKHLPFKIQKLMIFSGLIYVFGALGLEMVGSKLVTSPNP